MDQHREPIGVVGLGRMGLPMAINLRRAGFEVVAWNRSDRPRTEATAAQLELVDDLATLGRRCPIVLTVLPDLPQVVEVVDAGLLGEGNVVHTLVVMGTVSPTDVREFAAHWAQRDVDVVDAPVSGGTKGAREGSLAIMVGGRADAVARVQPAFEAMGTTVVHLGGPGNGQLAKAANQLVVAATTVGLAEALLLAERGGLDVTAVLQLLAGGLAASEVLEQKRDRFARGHYDSDGAASYLAKDLGFVGGTARREQIDLPLAATLARMYDEVVAAGLGDLDSSVVRRWLAEREAKPG